MREYDEANLFQGLACRTELVYDFRAVLSLIYHPLKAAYLPLNPPKPYLYVVSCVRGRFLRMDTPGGMVY